MYDNYFYLLQAKIKVQPIITISHSTYGVLLVHNNTVSLIFDWFLDYISVLALAESGTSLD